MKAKTIITIAFILSAAAYVFIPPDGDTEFWGILNLGFMLGLGFAGVVVAMFDR